LFKEIMATFKKASGMKLKALLSRQGEEIKVRMVL
jgi:hypothetical protein